MRVARIPEARQAVVVALERGHVLQVIAVAMAIAVKTRSTIGSRHRKRIAQKERIARHSGRLA